METTRPNRHIQQMDDQHKRHQALTALISTVFLYVLLIGAAVTIAAWRWALA